MKTIILGAGISGLATAYALLQRDPKLDLLLLEATGRVGGKVWSDKSDDGFLCESGVNAFLDNKPDTLALSRALGLSMVTGFAASRHRFVYSQHRLHELPATPFGFLRSNLLSVSGRLRVMLETLLPRGRIDDESLANFASRRLGREAFEKLIDPMASGVFAGDAQQLSLKSCFPRIHEVENEHRSLILGLIKLQAKARWEGRKDSPTAGPGGKLTSFAQGMSTLPQAIAEQLGERIRLSSPVTSITREGQRYVVHLGNGKTEEAERVILAAPAFAQQAMLRELAPDIANTLAEIPYPPLAVVCLGYRRKQIKHSLNGFGFLVPSRERRKVLGTLWDSSIFPQRAPQGYVLLRSMVGGARAPELAQLPQDKLVDVVRKEIRDTMGIDAAPDFVRVYPHPQAIPQYVVGHAQRLKSVDGLLQKHPNLILTGNAYKGVALNDCIANANRLAASLYPQNPDRQNQ